MKNQLNRDLIEALNESGNDVFVENTNSIVYELVNNVITDISLKSPFVKPERVFIQPVNEIVTGAITQLSEFTYFLGIDNPQIENNSKTRKNLWKNLWREFRASWRIGRKKKYKKNKDNKNPSLESIEKYQLSDFRHDVVMKMADYLTESSLIHEFGQFLTVVGNEDFGTNVRIKIYICSLDMKNQTYKIYKTNKNKFFSVNFGQRYINLSAKERACGKTFVDILKIFNALFSRAYNYLPNQILLESIIYSCPNSLFDGDDIYKTFINVANYLRFVDPRSFVSICNASKNIFEEDLIIKPNNQVDFSRIINMLDKFKY